MTGDITAALRLASDHAPITDTGDVERRHLRHAAGEKKLRFLVIGALKALEKLMFLAIGALKTLENQGF